MKIEKEKMTIDSHSRGSQEDHNRRKVKKEDAKENGKRLIQEEIDKGIVDMILEEIQDKVGS